MKVSDFRTQLENWEKEGKLEAQTVEFVLNSQKYFAADVKAGTNTMTFDITRSNYTPLPLQELKRNLSIPGGDIEIQITQAGSEKSIEQLYLSDDFIEIILN